MLALVLAGLNSPASNKSILKFAEVGEITGFNFYDKTNNQLIIIIGLDIFVRVLKIRLTIEFELIVWLTAISAAVKYK